MVLFNIDGNLGSHWVTVVGHHGTGASEQSGRHVVGSLLRRSRWQKLNDASQWVYGMRHPMVECAATTPS